MKPVCGRIALVCVYLIREVIGISTAQLSVDLRPRSGELNDHRRLLCDCRSDQHEQTPAARSSQDTAKAIGMMKQQVGDINAIVSIDWAQPRPRRAPLNYSWLVGFFSATRTTPVGLGITAFHNPTWYDRGVIAQKTRWVHFNLPEQLGICLVKYWQSPILSSSPTSLTSRLRRFSWGWNLKSGVWSAKLVCGFCFKASIALFRDIIPHQYLASRPPNSIDGLGRSGPKITCEP